MNSKDSDSLELTIECGLLTTLEVKLHGLGTEFRVRLSETAVLKQRESRYDYHTSYETIQEAMALNKGRGAQLQNLDHALSSWQSAIILIQPIARFAIQLKGVFCPQKYSQKARQKRAAQQNNLQLVKK